MPIFLTISNNVNMPNGDEIIDFRFIHPLIHFILNSLQTFCVLSSLYDIITILNTWILQHSTFFSQYFVLFHLFSFFTFISVLV